MQIVVFKNILKGGNKTAYKWYEAEMETEVYRGMGQNFTEVRRLQ